jgi:spermidine synthase
MFRRKTIYSGASSYGSYKVVDMKYNDRSARILFGSNHTPQSGVAKDGNLDLLFDYNQRFLEIVSSIMPQSILVIGGGVLTLPSAVQERFSDITIDVVEIDALLIQLAQDYFQAPQNDRIRTHISDGLRFLTDTHDKYDLIIVDAFSGHDIPAHLLQRAAASQYARHLNPSGVLAINLISAVQAKRPQLVSEVLEAFGQFFSVTRVYQADTMESLKEQQNLIVTASQEAREFDYLQSIDVRHHIK